MSNLTFVTYDEYLRSRTEAIIRRKKAYQSRPIIHLPTDTTLDTCIKTTVLSDHSHNGRPSYEYYFQMWKAGVDPRVLAKDGKTRAHHGQGTNLPEYSLFVRKLNVIETICEIRVLRLAIFSSSPKETTTTTITTSTVDKQIDVDRSTTFVDEGSNVDLIDEEGYKRRIVEAYTDTIKDTLGDFIFKRQQQKEKRFSLLFAVSKYFLISIFSVYILVIYRIWHGSSDPEIASVREDDCYRMLSPYLIKKMKNLKRMTTEYHRDVTIMVVNFNMDGSKEDKVRRLESVSTLVTERRNMFNVTEVKTMLKTDMFISG